MFDLSVAHITRSDRERELAADLDRRRMLKDAAGERPAAETDRPVRVENARSASRITATGR